MGYSKSAKVPSCLKGKFGQNYVWKGTNWYETVKENDVIIAKIRLKMTLNIIK